MALDTYKKVYVRFPEAFDMQAGPLGQKSITKNILKQLLDDDMLDDNGNKVSTVTFAPIDLITALGAVTAATIDLQTGHTNFTLNNMIACFVASEILQVGAKSRLLDAQCA